MKHTIPLVKITALLFATLLIACHQETKIVKKETSQLIFSNKNAETDSSSSALLAPYKMKMEAIMNELLGNSDISMVKGNPEGLLGNFVSDACLSITNTLLTSQNSEIATMCLFNNGGLRSSLPKGAITLRNVYELMPFDNAMVILTLSGEKTKMLFEYLVEANGAPVAGVRIKSVAKKIVEVKVNNQLFDEKKNYRILTSDYLSAGGDKYNFFKDPLKIDTVHYLIRDALLDFIKAETLKGKNITSKKDGRITIE